VSSQRISLSLLAGHWSARSVNPQNILHPAF
jgi:hypothetical protein